MHPRTTISPCHLKCCRNFVVFTNAFTGSPNQICACRHYYPTYPLSQHFLPTSWCSLVWDVMEHCLGTVESRAVRGITHSFKNGRSQMCDKAMVEHWLAWHGNKMEPHHMLQTKISGTLPVSSMEGSLQGGQNPLEGGTGLPAALISLYIFKYEICVVLGCVFKAFFILNGYC